MQVPNQVQEHIDTIAKHEQEFLARRSPAERLGDITAAVVGNLGFVAAHICLFLFWILVNTLHLPRIPRFDPMPFQLLATVVAMEAILWTYSWENSRGMPKRVFMSAEKQKLLDAQASHANLASIIDEQER